MKQQNTPIISKLAYYAPSPMLTVDGSGRIADFNVAFEVLFGVETGTYRQQLLSDSNLAGNAQLPQALLSWDLLNPAQQDDENTMEASLLRGFCSARFGKVDFRVTVLRLRQEEPSSESQITMYWEILRVERENDFHRILQRELLHRLTWESYASSYDRVLPVLLFYREVVERHVEAMSAADMNTVLDFGGGTGNVTGRLLDGRREVTLVDLSRAMLDRFRAKLPPQPPSKLTILEQNAEKLVQCTQDSFDGVTILLALYDMDEPRAALHEAIRVLKPGGILIVTEPKKCFDLQPLLSFAEEIFRAQGVAESLRADWDRVIRANRVLDPRTRRDSLSAEEIRVDLEEQGFEIQAMNDSHLGNCASLLARKPHRT